MDYDVLLSRARSKLPESVLEKERFELPKVVGRLEGSKTVISNFAQIAAALRRPMEHLLKYLLKELATPGQIRGNFLVLGAKLPASRINDKIKQYADEFVFCQKCGKPDTDIKKEGGFHVLVCSVCGERRPVKSKI
ncbi:translation initiation factor IF-2 subunit beta [Candidatus Woesearchaeota archaeon]|nr:translation initiation factor IF-2 subunit beta [Candidatus Woesearchaeota archaeon]